MYIFIIQAALAWVSPRIWDEENESFYVDLLPPQHSVRINLMVLYHKVFFGNFFGGADGFQLASYLHELQQVLRNFFSNFGLIFQYVSPLEPWIWDPKEKIFCRYRNYAF